MPGRDGDAERREGVVVGLREEGEAGRRRGEVSGEESMPGVAGRLGKGDMFAVVVR
jgi:hypothetical protein